MSTPSWLRLLTPRLAVSSQCTGERVICSRPTIDQGEIWKCAAEQTFGYVPADPAGPPFERLVPGRLEMRRRTTGLKRHRANGYVRYIEAVGMGLIALVRQ